MTNFGNLRKLNLRDVWKNEAREFTPWLAKNISELGKTLGMELELKQMEASVGEFSLDLLANDVGRNKAVIIENQISSTDHDHLGKLLTYASGFDASVIIWIAETIREEHRQALDWLNQRTDTDTEFFGVVIEILQIDDSKPAYNFNPIVFPNEWQKSKKRPGSNQVSEKMEAYRCYFQDLIDELREKYNFTNARKGQPQSWYSFASGYSGITYGTSFALGNRIRVDLYLDQGDAEKNKQLFDTIYQDKEVIESKFDEDLEWERLDDKKASRIAIYRNGSIDSDGETLKEIKDWSIEKLLKFKEVFSPNMKRYIKRAL
ncbi:MAG: DUF4268 domain-containing protein [Candidatus Lokiarchaeota archaeon]|nr:DUF4268 domain-containing protein [Candidatus Lokiarchaeota archaeon]